MRFHGGGAGTPFVLTVVAVSAVLCGWSLQRAVQLDDLPARGTPGEVFEVARVVRPAGEPQSMLVAALESAPFRPERRRPTGRFRLPGDPSPVAEVSPAAADVAAVPVVQLQLIGTVVAPRGRSFAMVQLGQEPAKLVRIGEKIGDFTLRQVEQGRAVFRSAAGARIEIKVNRMGG